MRGTWNILNSLIRNCHSKENYPHCFVDNDKPVNTMEDVVNKFNSFFGAGCWVHVGAGPWQFLVGLGGCWQGRWRWHNYTMV